MPGLFILFVSASELTLKMQQFQKAKLRHENEIRHNLTWVVEHYQISTRRNYLHICGMTHLWCSCLIDLRIHNKLLFHYFNWGLIDCCEDLFGQRVILFNLFPPFKWWMSIWWTIDAWLLCIFIFLKWVSRLHYLFCWLWFAMPPPLLSVIDRL